MNKKSYLSRLVLSDEQESSKGGGSLVESLESLHEKEWSAFINDVVYRHPVAYEALGPGKGEDLLVAASTRLRRLSLSGQRLAGRAVHGLLAASLEDPLADKQSRDLRPVIDLLYLAGILPAEVPTSTLLRFVVTPIHSSEVRIAAAKALVKRADSLPLEIWLRIKVEALPELPEILQPLISGLSARYPAEALSVLVGLEISFSRTEMLESPLRLALRRTLAVDEGFVHVARVLRSAPSWAREVLKRVLGFAEFAKSSVLVARISSVFPPSETDAPSLFVDADSDVSELISPREINRHWIEDSLVESLDSFRNSGVFEAQRLEAIFALIGEHPSVSVFSALVAFFEAILLDALLGNTRIPEEDVDITLRRTLDGFAHMTSVIRSLIPSREAAAWPAYRRSLHMALKRSAIAEQAFEQLISFAREPSEVSLTVRLALGQEHFTAERCRKVILRYWPALTCDTILSEVVDLEAEQLDDFIDSDSEVARVALKLRSLDVRYIRIEHGTTNFLALTLLDHRAIPATFTEWADSIRRLHASQG